MTTTEGHDMVTCPECENQFRFIYADDESDEEFGAVAECPECGSTFDPETA